MKEEDRNWLMVGLIIAVVVFAFLGIGGFGMFGTEFIGRMMNGGFGGMMGSYNPFTLFLSIVVQILLIAVPVVILIYFFRELSKNKEKVSDNNGKDKEVSLKENKR